jgi:hypothetical protein
VASVSLATRPIQLVVLARPVRASILAAEPSRAAAPAILVVPANAADRKTTHYVAAKPAKATDLMTAPLEVAMLPAGATGSRRTSCRRRRGRHQEEHPDKRPIRRRSESI